MRLRAEPFRHSLRMLSRHKRFSALAIASLSVAIALNTTMYSVLDAMISPKLDMREPDRLYVLPFFGDYRRQISIQELNQALQSQMRFHEGITGSMGTHDERLVERGSRLREANIITVAPNYFSVLGVRASAGRLLSPADVGLESRPVVLSERLWNQLFPEKERFEPMTVFVNGESRVVVGTLSYRADLPGRYTDVWQVPVAGALASVPLNLARLRPNATLEQAATELEGLARLYRTRLGEDQQTGFAIRSATKPPFRPWKFHWALIGSVVAVLLIACANLANLQLARGVSRARELATRAAVGASRADIVAQLVIESAWLAFGGLVLGAVLTAWGMRLADASVPPVLADYVTRPQVSWRVVVFAVGAMLFCLTLVGLAPAIKLSRVDINQVLKSGAGTGKSKSARRRYGALVIAEVGLALALLTSASLLIRAAYEVHAFSVQQDKRQLVFTMFRITRESPADRRTRRDWSQIVVAKSTALDSVASAATMRTAVPPKRAIAVYDAAGVPRNYPVPRWGYSVVSPDYFRAFKIPILNGRDFSPGEFAEPQVILDRAAANFLWPGRNPIGQQIKLDSAQTLSPWLRVVGVAAEPGEIWFNTDQDAAREARRQRAARSDMFRGSIYVLNAHDTLQVSDVVRRGRLTGEFFRMVVRGTGDSRRLAMKLRTAIPQMGPNLNVYGAQSWEESSGIDRLRARHDFVATLFVLFAVMALALAALGVYAIIAHMVAQRTREFGVRIAVGAGTRDIRELVIREGNILTLSGIAVGLIITYYNASLVRAFVFSDYDRYDSRVFAVAALFLFGVAWLASYLPARRAMRIDPVEALRND